MKSVYKITDDTDYQNQRYGITPALHRQLESLAIEVHNKKNTKVIDRIMRLIEEFPGIPMLKNYLSVAYSVRGNYEKSTEINDLLLAEHPDYLFAKLNKANFYIDHDEFDKVPEILGTALEISQLYPEREIFHIGEIISFYKVIIRYYAAIENLELAEKRFEELKSLAPGYEDVEEAEEYLYMLRLKNVAERLEKERELAITPEILKPLPEQTEEEPQFNHPEIQNLYEFGLLIPHEKLHEILALPRASLIEDLERVLQDATERYEYFTGLEWEEETHSFVLHALFLLMELKASESLPQIFSFLEYDDDFLELWIGDHKTDTLWQCFYSLAFTNTALLKEFLLRPGIDTYVKTAVSEALCQIVLHHPERRNEMLAVYSEVLTRFWEATLEDNLIDSDFLGLAIGDIVDCRLFELKPVIKGLFDKGYVALGIGGDYNAVEKEFSEKEKSYHKKKVFTIFDLYDNVLNTWSGYKEDHEENSYKPLIPAEAVSEKIGRNDPCSCGSGKKYKKCCMK